jgi:hypothetical protein
VVAGLPFMLTKDFVVEGIRAADRSVDPLQTARFEDLEDAFLREMVAQPRVSRRAEVRKPEERVRTAKNTRDLNMFNTRHRERHGCISGSVEGGQLPGEE